MTQKISKTQRGSVSTEVQEDAGLSAEMLRSALEASPHSVFLFDRAGRLRFAAVQGVEGELLQSWTAQAQLGSACCKMFWHLQGGKGCVVDRAIESRQNVEFEVATGVRADIPVYVSVRPLTPAGSDKPLGALVTARDISDLRRTEAAGIAQRSLMASIADRSPDEIYALDKLGRVTWRNQRAETGGLLILCGQPFIDSITPDCRGLISEALNQALSGKDTHEEIRAVRPDESGIDFEANTSPLWRDGEVDGVLVFLRDITERKRTQELVSQSAKIRAVGELAAGVAHNLNNSLTVIKGRTQLLQMRAADESSLKSLQVINEAVEDGSKTLRRILDFARRDSVQEFGPVELDDLVKSSIEIARPKWQQKSTPGVIQVKIECNGPVHVKGILAELREVVLNLIFNAVDAMPDGGVMEVGTRSEIDVGCFWVADTGCGMPPETIARIFEPFFTTKGQRGTGLGLSASHGIISRHGGEILAVSEPGEGTRFEVRLPISASMLRLLKSDFRATDQDSELEEILPLR